jgi:rod shape-determining protein MreC
VFLMVADTRMQVVAPLRAAIAMALAADPARAAGAGGHDRRRQRLPARAGQRAGGRGFCEARARRTGRARPGRRTLATENKELRGLLGLSPSLTVRSQAAQVMYEAADPFSRKIFIDRGLNQGLVLGAPVITEAGVIGQVTRVYPLSAEVTLLTDRDAAIPLLNTRTQQRAAAFGGVTQGNAMELRFVASSADVQVGDLLHTSGVDGIYPAGLPVARVTAVDRQAEGTFARITLAPVAAVDGVRHVLVLEPLRVQLPPPPAAEPASAPRAPVRSRK